MLRYKTEIAWFSRLVRHPARKRSGSIFKTPESARGQNGERLFVAQHSQAAASIPAVREEQVPHKRRETQ